MTLKLWEYFNEWGIFCTLNVNLNFLQKVKIENKLANYFISKMIQFY